MILDLETDSALPASGRYIIVGAGAVGLLLATTLSRQGASVLVLESGGRAFDSAAQSLNEAEIAGRPHLGVTEGRARLLGGTTHLWGGQLVAFDTTDFEARPWLGVEAWPIDRATLDPWYEAVARTLGLDSTVSDDTDVWRDLGLKQPLLDGAVPVVLTRWLKEPNFARLFSAELTRSDSLSVVLNATCTDIRLDGGRVTGVAATAPSGKTVWFEGEQVILACGTIEASRLMLALAQRQPAAPWAGNPWIGRAFQDHLDAPAARVEIIDRRRFGDVFNYATREAVEILNQKLGLFDRGAPQAGLAASQAVAAKRGLKERLYNRLPFGLGPVAYFLYRYFIQLGFLDGREGAIYHGLQGLWYRFLVEAKVLELQRGIGERTGEDALVRLSELTGLKLAGSPD